ncbi:hypothetical protein COV19_01660 [Candidatus Woesearchaeota archaeon CG10_big_fil_rev_8_21_14_0_10_44_13]|nr:MAG: hypothetical protein COV19_01660 [Candidatus Woesearchaeota archaeon CG10_big_fil_rev_8_21_14_0_10_44_13]
MRGDDCLIFDVEIYLFCNTIIITFASIAQPIDTAHARTVFLAIDTAIKDHVLTSFGVVRISQVIRTIERSEMVLAVTFEMGFQNLFWN